MMENKGRPYDTQLDEAIIESAKALLIEKGFEGLTVSEIVQAAGTTRSAFYRRYKDFVALMVDILLSEYTTDLDKTFDTGSLASDLLALQEDQLELFTDPMVNRALSGFFGQLRSDDRSRKEFLELFLQPRRDSTRAILDRAVVRGEIHDDYDIDLICDTLTGPFIFRVIIPEIGPLDDRLVDGTVRMVLNDLNHTSSL